MSDIQPIFLVEERALPATVSLRVSGAKFKEARHQPRSWYGTLASECYSDERCVEVSCLHCMCWLVRIIEAYRIKVVEMIPSLELLTAS
jgi:hypothetical protein